MNRLFGSDLFHVIAGAFALTCVAFVSAQAQDADTRPLVAVYPIKVPQNTITGENQAQKNAVLEIIQADKLDPAIILLKTEEGLRNSKKMRLFERGTGGLSSVNQEQVRAACGNGGPVPGGLDCEKRFAGNAAAAGQLSNVEFIVELAIMDLSIGDVVYRNIPEMPGKFRRSVVAKLDLAVKVLDSTSGQIKFQSILSANYTESGIALDKSESTVDKRAIWNGLANDAGKKAASAIVGAMN